MMLMKGKAKTAHGRGALTQQTPDSSDRRRSLRSRFAQGHIVQGIASTIGRVAKRIGCPIPGTDPRHQATPRSERSAGGADSPGSHQIAGIPVAATRRAAAVIITMAAALLWATPASAQLIGTIWSATLNVKDLGGSAFGCINGPRTGIKCSESAVLSEDHFTMDGQGYTIDDLYRTAGSNRLTMDLETGSRRTSYPELTLHVGTTELSWADGAIQVFTSGLDAGRTRIAWADAATFTNGDTVALKITRQLPYQAPQFIPYVDEKYLCFMAENPAPGELLCGGYNPDNWNERLGEWAYTARDTVDDTLTG